MIPMVAAQDFGWACVLVWMLGHCKRRVLRGVVGVVLGYVIVEFLLHEHMEDWAARALF